MLDRRQRLNLAAFSELDCRTIERAEQHGISSLRSEADRERLKKAARRLHIELPDRVEGHPRA